MVPKLAEHRNRDGNIDEHLDVNGNRYAEHRNGDGNIDEHLDVDGTKFC